MEAKNVSAPNLGPNSEEWDPKELNHWLTTKTKTDPSVIETIVEAKIYGDELKTASTKMLSRKGINLTPDELTHLQDEMKLWDENALSNQLDLFTNISNRPDFGEIMAQSMKPKKV